MLRKRRRDGHGNEAVENRTRWKETQQKVHYYKGWENKLNCSVERMAQCNFSRHAVFYTSNVLQFRVDGALRLYLIEQHALVFTGCSVPFGWASYSVLGSDILSPEWQELMCVSNLFPGAANGLLAVCWAEVCAGTWVFAYAAVCCLYMEKLFDHEVSQLLEKTLQVRGQIFTAQKFILKDSVETFIWQCFCEKVSIKKTRKNVDISGAF